RRHSRDESLVPSKLLHKLHGGRVRLRSSTVTGRARLCCEFRGVFEKCFSWHHERFGLWIAVRLRRVACRACVQPPDKFTARSGPYGISPWIAPWKAACERLCVSPGSICINAFRPLNRGGTMI